MRENSIYCRRIIISFNSVASAGPADISLAPTLNPFVDEAYLFFPVFLFSNSPISPSHRHVSLSRDLLPDSRIPKILTQFTSVKSLPSKSAGISHYLGTWWWEKLGNHSIYRGRVTTRTSTVLFLQLLATFLCFKHLRFSKPTFPAPVKLLEAPSYTTQLTKASAVIGDRFSMMICSIHWLELITSMHARLPLGQPSVTFWAFMLVATRHTDRR